MGFIIKRITLISLSVIFLLTCCSCNSVTAEKADEIGSRNQNQGITVSSQLRLVDFPNDKRMEAMEYTFPDGTKMLTLPGDAKTIFLINGTYDLNIDSAIVNDVFMVSIKDLCDSLGINAASDSDKTTITTDKTKIVFQSNNDTALVNDKKSTLVTAPTRIKNKLFVPLSFICSALNLDADLFDPPVKNYLFGDNTVITIDQKSTLDGFSEEEAYDYLKDNLDTAYSHFEDNFKKLYNPDSGRLLSSSVELKKDIESLKFAGRISKYYRFEGLAYTIFLDKYSKDVYFKIPTTSSADIKKINFDDETLFEENYMVD